MQVCRVEEKNSRIYQSLLYLPLFVQVNWIRKMLGNVCQWDCHPPPRLSKSARITASFCSRPELWDVIFDNSIRIVLDDWSISINYENRRQVVNADQSINQVQGVSFDHNYCSCNFCQSITSCRTCNSQYVDKSIYVGANPLQYMDNQLIMTTDIGHYMLIQNSLNLGY